MRVRGKRNQIKPSMSVDQLQEFIAVGLAQQFKARIEERRGHPNGHEPLVGVLAGKQDNQ